MLGLRRAPGSGPLGLPDTTSRNSLQNYFRPPALPPTLPVPAVPVRDCSRRHWARSCPVSVSHRPLERSGSGGAVAPLVLTLLSVSGGRWLVPWVPTESALVPVEGDEGSGRGCALPATPPLFVPMLDPDCVCADTALQAVRSAIPRRWSFMRRLSRLVGSCAAIGMPDGRASGQAPGPGFGLRRRERDLSSAATAFSAALFRPSRCMKSPSSPSR